jgi:sugar phosphate isomerase/epimerase
MNRRAFLQAAAGGCALTALGALQERESLAGEIGITTGSFNKHLSPGPAPGRLQLLDLPARMRDELGLRVIDLMTATLVSLEPDYWEKLRAAAERAGCMLTNLKMNQPGLDLANADAAVRRRALDEYKRTIEAAARLGVRWVRPLPGPVRPDLARLAASYRELMDYAGERGIALLVENYGWMKDDPDAIPAIVAAVGRGLRAQPDTGNWTDAARSDGLARAFPHAASCDFKFLTLTPDGDHAHYDLRRCFQIGWDAGFRGPWCFEHFHSDLNALFRDLAFMRDRLREWARSG